MNSKKKGKKTTAEASHRSPSGTSQARGRHAKTHGEYNLAPLLDGINDGIVAFDLQMNYIYVNARGGEMLGRKPADLIGKNYWTEFPEAKGTPFANAYVKALETQEALVIEDYYASWDRWFENRIYPSKDGLSIFFTEITERKKTQLEIEQLKTFNEAIIQSSNEAIVVVGVDGIFKMINRAGAEIYGRRVDEIVGHHWKEIIPPDQHAIVESVNGERLQRKSNRYDLELARPNGERRNVLVSGSPLFESGKFTGTMAVFTDTTERKRAEEKLYESERRLSSVIANSPDTIYLMDVSTGKAPLFNREEFFGYSRTELEAPGSLLSLVHSNDLPLVQENWKQTMAGDGNPVEYRLRTKSGAIAWISQRVTILSRNEQGAPAQILVTLSDITERKQAEENLRLSEQRFSNAFYTSPAGMTITRIADGKFVDANDAFCDMFEFNREEVIGHTSTELNMWTPEERKKLIDEQIKSGGLQNFELRARSKSGRMVDILFSSKPMQVRGEPYHVTTMIDITERKRGEEQIRYQANLLANVTDAIVAGDENFVITSLNKAAEQMYGWKAEEVIGRSSAEVFRSEFAGFTRAEAIQILRDTGELQVEAVQYRKDGSTILSDGKTVALRDNDGKVTGYVTVNRDITERKQAEKAVRESKEMFQAIFQSTPVSTLLATIPEGRIHDVNDAYLRLTGFESKEEVLGKSIDELGLAYDVETQERILQEFSAKGRVNNAEMTFRDSNGLEHTVLVGMSPINIGERSFLLSTSLDITERKQAEKTVRESEERWRLALRAANLGTWLVHLDTGKFEADSVGKVIHGLGADEALSTLEQGNRYIHPDDIPEIQRKFNHAVQTKGVYENEYRVALPDGVVRWIYSLGKALSNTPYIIGVVQDITERVRAEEELRRRVEELAALNALSRRVSQSLSLNEVIQSALDELAAPLQTDAAMIFLREGDKLILKGLRVQPPGLSEADMPVHAVGECLCGIAAGLKQPVFSGDIQKDGRCNWDECKKAGYVSFAALPLQSGEEVIGVLGLASKTPRDFSVQAEYLKTVAASVGLGLQNARLLEETRLSRDRLADLSRRLAEIREREARSIGRELHDQIGQILTALKLILDVAPQLPPDIREKKHAQAQELVNDLLTRVSRLSLELRPPMLDDLGIIPALLWHVNRYQEQTGIAVDFIHSGVEGERFASEIETSAYRIAQEAFTNVARHARAGRARLNVQKRGGWLEIQIEDDGAGFDVESALSKHRGLSGMRERAQLVGGEFRVESKEGEGTRILIRLPLQEETA